MAFAVRKNLTELLRYKTRAKHAEELQSQVKKSWERAKPNFRISEFPTQRKKIFSTHPSDVVLRLKTNASRRSNRPIHLLRKFERTDIENMFSRLES